MLQNLARPASTVVPGWPAIFALGWLVYVGLLAAVFTLNRMALGQAVLIAGMLAAPSALLGAGVPALCRRLPWRLDRALPLVMAHGTLAALFSATSLALTNLFRAACTGLAGGSWAVPWPSGGALRFHLVVGGLVYVVLVAATYAAHFAGRVREEERRVARAEILRIRAELQTLRAQLNPHFLLNTLHSVMALMRRNVDDAEHAIDQLTALLSYALGAHRDSGEFVTVAEEWGFVRQYLALERLRLGDRLDVGARIDPGALNALVPVFLIQPLVENAIVHSIAPRQRGGRLEVCIDLLPGERLRIIVRDDGGGAHAKPGRPASGVGLGALKQRIAAVYGAEGQLAIEASPERGFRVEMNLPGEPPESILAGRDRVEAAV